MKPLLFALPILLALSGCQQTETTPVQGAIAGTVPSLAASSWSVSAVDEDGNDWAGSTLYLRSDDAGPQNTRRLHGHFCWTTPVARGKELVAGQVNAQGQVELIGTDLPPPSHHLVKGRYRAQLVLASGAAAGAQTLQGRWDAVDEEVAPSAWAAQRSAQDFSRCSWE